MACRFLDARGNGYLDGALDCLKTCREVEGANITSNSWGGGSYSQALYDEIKVRAWGTWGGGSFSQVLYDS